MTPNELFEEKQHLVHAAITQHFGSYAQASKLAKSNNMELDDLFQVARMLLWELCVKYDPKREDTFNAYVMKFMKWRMSNELHIKGKVIRVGTNVTSEERKNLAFHSIDIQIEDDTKDDYFAVSPVNVEEEVMLSVEYTEALSKLTPQEKVIVVKKSQGYKDDEIGKELGKSRQTISRLKTAAFKKINPNYKPIGTTSLLSECKKIKNHLLAQVI
ncbi:sigma-70 family RNA polymerase sigma factor [Bacillus toyonensis]|uniref:RNA polymerase subunit sigma n=1 Tax=Bacillus toyonensis TaxID=155322 RepID=A0A2B5X888_9BACI|nr:sigma-70 family RNA polymerase sigma factor [Bacillus toyonensis]PGA92161.1 RNA polymerase subunit sigma [Bacillus toyonensis]PHD61244.1 RNA polymerase subunit sigma [Bacillus toyonensis]